MKYMLLGAVMCVLSMVILTARAAGAEHRSFPIGGMEVVALVDVGMDPVAAPRPELLLGLDAGLAEKYLVPGGMANSINCFLVRMDGRNILFDTGLGFGGNRGGGMLPSLAAAGIAPEEIDAVCITHFHFDHVGGLLRDDEAVFPKARLLVPRLEVVRNGKGSGAFLSAYSDRLTEFDWGGEVYPGITAIDANGHTPGHTAFLVENGGGRLLIIGDLVHFQKIQLPLPDVSVTYDTDPVQAARMRRMLFDRAASEDLPIASMHMVFPGMGKLTKAGDGYLFSGMGLEE